MPKLPWHISEWTTLHYSLKIWIFFCHQYYNMMLSFGSTGTLYCSTTKQKCHLFAQLPYILSINFLGFHENILFNMSYDHGVFYLDLLTRQKQQKSINYIDPRQVREFWWSFLERNKKSWILCDTLVLFWLQNLRVKTNLD